MIRRPLLLLGLVVGAWLVMCAVLFVWPRTDQPPARADAVVVLNGARNLRLDPGIRLVRQGIAPVLVISGPDHDRRWLKARRLCRLGQVGSVRVVCFEPVPFSTRGEARGVARIAREHGWSRIVVVTSTFHVTRTRMLFDRCYHGQLWTVGVPAPWWRMVENWAFETGKLAVQLTVERRC